jgi:2-haloacid dehalogenase
VKEAGETISSEFLESLMKAYDALDTFDDVDAALTALHTSSNSEFNSVIFSNGTKKMVAASVDGSPSLTKQKELFSNYIVIDEIPSEQRKYKPAPVTYQYLLDTLKSEKKNTWLITSNAFDVDGAQRFGIRVCWVNRQGNEWIDGLGDEPELICSNVGEGFDKIKQAA